MDTRVSEKAVKEQYPVFSRRILDRLRVGVKTYGDASFYKAPVELIEATQEELLDVNGWSFILWCVLENVKEQLRKMHANVLPPPDIKVEAAGSVVEFPASATKRPSLFTPPNPGGPNLDLPPHLL